ncbi:MAG: tetratricopeptide repeat protein [Flavobacteriales bacterium]
MKKRSLLILIIFQISLIQSSFGQEDVLFEESESLIEQKKYNKAIEKLDKVLELNPNFVGAFVNRGISNTALKNYKVAINDFKSAISLDSLNTLSFFYIANNYRKLKDIRSAIFYYDNAEKSAENSFSNQSANFNLKRTFLNGISPFQVSLYQIRYHRGLAFYDLKNYKSALKDFISIDDVKKSRDSKFMLASSLLKLERKKEACSEFENAIDLGSEDAIEVMKVNCY